MRRAFLLALCLLLAVCVAPVPSATGAEPTGKMIVGKDAVDLDRRELHFKLTTPAESARFEIFSADGRPLHEGSRDYGGAKPGTRLTVGWPDLGVHENNFRLELAVDDTEGNTFTYQLIRFYFEIPHEEVVFASGDWAIEPEEEEKLVEPLALLKEALAKYSKYIELQVYVAGYTDTVGPDHENQVLSQKRAQSIAEYFASHGLTGVPVFVRGFGESSLAVKTGDNVPEQRNRRAQYIISTSAPAMAGRGAWKRVK